MALIDIGSQKQLFVDDYLIESISHARPVLQPAFKPPENPVLKAERPWEGRSIYIKHLFRDESDGLLKMWYETAHGEETPSGEKTGHVCYATSEDGVEWTRPELGLVEFDGSTRNNIVPEKVDGYIKAMFLDPTERDHDKRYKGIVQNGSTDVPGQMRIDLYYSPDGFHWTPYADNPVIDRRSESGRWGPTRLMGWDPIREVYAIHNENCHHQRCPMGRRVIGRAESPDMIHWNDSETIIVPDELDMPDTEFYAMPATVYEGLYVGMLWIFRTNDTTHYPEAVFSRDGIHYRREFRRPFIQRGDGYGYDSACVYSWYPIAVGDKLVTHFTGTNSRAPARKAMLGDKATSAVGVGISPLDGIVALEGVKGPREGWGHRDAVPYSTATTRAFSFTGSQLHLNHAAVMQGGGAEPCQTRVELLRSNHHVIDGFSVEDADPIDATGTDITVSWNGKSNLSALQGRTVKLRFYLRNAKLYSFWFGD